MHLTLGRPDHLNTNVSDEQGNVLYNVSTSAGLFTKKMTTIRKYSQNGGETMGVIEWPQMLDGGLFRFNGREIPVDVMFQTRMWSTSLYFVGPDQRTYKWKLSPRCWMKPADSDVELVRFHRQNWGILKAAHPPYLDVSPGVIHMLDLIILTFVYAEWKHKELEARRRRGARSRSGGAMSRSGALGL